MWTSRSTRSATPSAFAFASMALLATFVLSPSDAADIKGSQTIQTKRSVIELHEDGTYQIKSEGRNAGRVLPRKLHIKLRKQSFDPLDIAALERAAATPIPLGISSSVDEKSSYIVQFHTQALEEFQRELTALNVRITAPLPEQALIVLMDEKTRDAVQQLPYVRWVGHYLPAYKIETTLMNALGADAAHFMRRYSIMVMERSMQQAVADYVEQIGGAVDYRSDTSRFEATLTAAQLSQLVARPEILFVEPATSIGNDLNQVRQTVGAEPLRLVAGYSGQGVAGEVVDEGFLLSHQELTGANVLVHSPQPVGSDGVTDHGSQVAGILFGRGTVPEAKGLLPDAARAIVFSRLSGFPQGFPTPAELRSNIAELTNPTGPYRAVFQTASFGHENTTLYNTVSAEYDEVLFDFDIVRTQSQGNTNTRASRPEAWAKNMVSVGGLDTLETLSRSDDKWDGASIGPASDGRTKPDLSAQYRNIFTMSGISNDTYDQFGGTSGATPIVAGTFGLLYQMWADGVFDGGPGKQGAPWFRDVFASKPHAATAKALMINSAFQYSFVGADHNLARAKQGWGMPDLKNLYDTAQANGWHLPVLINEDAVLAPLQTHTYNVTANGATPLKITLVYKDPRGNPAASVQRINDLTLKAISPSGAVYWGNAGLSQGNWSTPGGTPNTVDTVENIFIRNPEVGSWQIQVLGDEIVQDGYPTTPAIDAVYALVATTGSTANMPPLVNAGPDQTISLPASATLAGVVSDDGRPQPTLAIQWTTMSGPGTVTYSNAAAVNSTASFSAPGTYVLRLTANDGEITSRDYVVITVQGASSQVFERRLSGGSNDAEQSTNGSVTLTDSDLDLGARRVGLRFMNVSIPRNATITSAYLQFQTDEVTTAATTATIRGQAADNAGTFTTSSNNISARPTTAASSSWSPGAWNTVGEVGAAQRTGDIRSIVQEIVNRGGWVSGNAMVFTLSGSGLRKAESVEGASSGAPLLHIEYQ